MSRPRSASEFVARYGPWAVVAGASEGLGAAFAGALARRGCKLLLLARRAEALEQVAAPLRASTEVRTAVVDLGDAELAATLAGLTAGLEVGLCVYNAAFSQIGPFLEQAAEDQQRTLDVNCRGPMIAARVLAPAMVQRGRGAILLMSSLTAFWGSPYVATYGASKAFNLSLGEALWYELGPLGVDVGVCCAGATSTPGFLRSSGAKGPRSMPPEAVAEEALQALGGPPTMIPGVFNKVAARLLSRLLPRPTAVRIMGAQTAKLGRGG